MRTQEEVFNTLGKRLYNIQRKEIIKKLKDYAKENNYILNPNRKILNTIISGLQMPHAKYGQLYCPCRMLKTDAEICPCVWHKREIEIYGKCHCNLFFERG